MLVFVPGFLDLSEWIPPLYMTAVAQLPGTTTTIPSTKRAPNSSRSSSGRGSGERPKDSRRRHHPRPASSQSWEDAASWPPPPPPSSSSPKLEEAASRKMGVSSDENDHPMVSGRSMPALFLSIFRQIPPRLKTNFFHPKLNAPLGSLPSLDIPLSPTRFVAKSMTDKQL